MTQRKNNSRGKGHRNTQEHFTKMLRSTMETRAWRALSPVAQALYPWLKLEWKGPRYNNNGKIRLSVRQAAKCLGVSINTAGKGFHELQAKGFIVMTAFGYLGVEGMAKSSTYELTELASPNNDNRTGCQLYHDWREGKDFEVKKSRTNNPTGLNGKKFKIPSQK